MAKVPILRGEPRVSDLAAGLLFHRREEDLPGLIDLLIGVGGPGEALGLIRELAPLHSQEICAHLCVRLQETLGVEALRFVTAILNRCGPRLSGGVRDEVRELLRKLLVDVDPITAIEAAAGLRVLDPSDLQAWDRLADAALDRSVSGYSLSAIPDSRLSAACDLARRRPKAGLELMERNQGPVEQQAILASVAEELFLSERERPWQFGYLVETKLYGLPLDARYRPWLSLARRIIDCKDESARTCVIYAVFRPEPWPCADLSELAGLVLHAALTEGERQEIARRICDPKSPAPEWRNMLLKCRVSACLEVDCELAERLSHGILQRDIDFRVELLEFWKALRPDEHSTISRAAIQAFADGARADEIFCRVFLDEHGC